MRAIVENKRNYYWVLFAIIVLGVILRLNLFLFDKSFWFDEASLALNVMNKSFGGLFGKLDFNQLCPWLFLFETKIITNFFGISERIFRLLPFLTSILSIFLFYPYCKYFIKNRTFCLLAMFFFAINTNLIYYSAEFKPYSFDVFATICLPLLLFRYKLKNPIFLGLIFALFPWYSYSSLIVEFALVLIVLSELIYHRKKLKNFFMFLAPQVLNLFVLGAHFSLGDEVRNYMTQLWSSSYIAHNFSNFFDLFLQNIFYIFHPFNYIMKAFPYFLPIVFAIFCTVGAIFALKQNKFKFWILILPFLITLTLSYLGIYPYFDRLTLFLTPIFIIFFVKFFELILKNKKAQLLMFAFLILISVNPTFKSMEKMKNLPSQDYEIFNLLHKKYKQGDFVVINDVSEPSMHYFLKRYEFPLDEKFIIKEPQYADKAVAFKHLMMLDKNKNYWIYTNYLVNPRAPKLRGVLKAISKEKGMKFEEYSLGKTRLYYVGK